MTQARADALPQRWSTGQRIKNTIIYWCIVVLVACTHRLPEAVTASLGAILGWLGYYLARHERHLALEHLALAFGEALSPVQRAAVARASFVHLGRCAGEALHAHRIIASGPARVVFEGDGLQVYQRALSEGRGVIFCTGHIGNWELFGQIMASHRPVWTVARRAYDPRITRLIDDYRAAGGIRSLWRGERPLRDLIADVLARGEVMGFLVDQDMRVPGIFVPFFGRPAYTSNAPALFAISSRAAVIVGHLHRTGRVHSVVIRRLELDWSAPPEQAVESMTRAISDQLEQAIRAVPEQWVWMHRRWKTKPPPQSELPQGQTPQGAP
jgi:Kdo2-lipid IVA lauroyltransferase/acyltransferase